MNSRSLVFDKYQHNSPKQLNGFPLVSVRLNRARGLVISRRTPNNSADEPLVFVMLLPSVRRAPVTFRSTSSSVSAENEASAIGSPCMLLRSSPLPQTFYTTPVLLVS